MNLEEQGAAVDGLSQVMAPPGLFRPDYQVFDAVPVQLDSHNVTP